MLKRFKKQAKLIFWVFITLQLLLVLFFVVNHLRSPKQFVKVVTFDLKQNSFVIKTANKSPFTLSLFYKTPVSLVQKANLNLRSDQQYRIFAGTCPQSNTDILGCQNDIVLGGLMKIQSSSNQKAEAYYFEMRDQQLHVLEKADSQTTEVLLAKEQNWFDTFKADGVVLAASTLDCAPIIPTLNCVLDQGNGKYKAYYDVNNTNDYSVEIPVNSSNHFDPAPDDRGQPTVFKPGLDKKAFSVTFTSGDVTWFLHNSSATANIQSKSCIVPTAKPTKTPTPSPTPTPRRFHPSPTPTRRPTATPTRGPSPTPRPTRTPTPTPVECNCVTPSPTPIPTQVVIVPTATRTPTPLPTATATPTMTPNPTATLTPTPSSTPRPTNTPTLTPTSTPAPTSTPRPTNTPAPSATSVPLPTLTPTSTPRPPTATPTLTSTPIPTATRAPSATPIPTIPTLAPSVVPTATLTPTPVPTVAPRYDLTVDAGPDKTINQAELALMEGQLKNINLPDNTQVELTWEKITGPGSIEFFGGGLTPQLQFTQTGVYELRLTATTNLTGPRSDNVRVTVTSSNTQANPTPTSTTPTGSTGEVEGTHTEPAPPTGGIPVVVDQVEHDNVTISWQPPDNTDHYSISYGTSPDANQYSNPNIGIGNNFTLFGLDSDTIYYLKLMAWNGSYQGALSRTVAVRTGSNPYVFNTFSKGFDASKLLSSDWQPPLANQTTTLTSVGQVKSGNVVYKPQSAKIIKSCSTNPLGWVVFLFFIQVQLLLLIARRKVDYRTQKLVNVGFTLLCIVFTFMSLCQGAFVVLLMLIVSASHNEFRRSQKIAIN